MEIDIYWIISSYILPDTIYILADQNMQISASQCFEFPFKVYWISSHPVDDSERLVGFTPVRSDILFEN